MELVTIETFWTGHEAELAKSALEAAGIDAVLDDAQIVNMTQRANMAQGIKLRVRGEDVERAREVLDTDSEPIETHVAQPVIEPGCPQCGSLDITRRSERLRTFLLVAVGIIGVGVAVGFSEASFFLILALGVFALISGRSRCNECGESWP
jgi:hypothetical protein